MTRQLSTENEYDTEHYDAISMLYTPEGAPLVILRSKTAAPVSWGLVKEKSSLFFPSHHELMNFCRTHHYSAENSSNSSQPVHHLHHTH